MSLPSGLEFTALEFPLSGLYVNTLLANLNARQFIRRVDVDTLEFRTDRRRTTRSTFGFVHDGKTSGASGSMGTRTVAGTGAERSFVSMELTPIKDGSTAGEEFALELPKVRYP